MKYAFYPGCVAQGAAPELYNSTIEVCRMLGIELDAAPMQSASCTGAGVLQEKNLRLGDTLNARNFALAERVFVSARCAAVAVVAVACMSSTAAAAAAV